MERTARLRLAIASVVVAAGFVGLSPSFASDSDRDGVADSIEIYELGTNPSSPDASALTVVADR